MPRSNSLLLFVGFRRQLFPLLLVFLVQSLSPFKTGADPKWSGFLGPGGVAVAPASETAATFSFDPEGPEVLWKSPSGRGHSSPVVWGENLFLSSTEDDGRTLVMSAFDCANGKLRWWHRVAGDAEASYGHIAADPAAPTPVTDGRLVWFYFGGYGLMAREVGSGQQVWEKRFSFEARGFGTANSPVLSEDSIFLVRDGGDDSSLWCFDKDSGELLWKSARPGLRYCYASPFLWKNRQRTEIVVPGTNTLMSYLVEDGRLLWTVSDLCRSPCTTPTGDRDRLYFAAWATPNAEKEEQNEQNFWGELELSDDEAGSADYIFDRFDANADKIISHEELPDSRARDAFAFFDRDKDGTWSVEEVGRLLAPRAPGRNLMVAINAGFNGELSENNGIAWTFDVSKALPYVPTPLLVGERIHLIKSGGIVTCLDAEMGTALYGPVRSGVSGEYFASPVAWGNQIITCGHRGIVSSIAGGDEFSVLATSEVDSAIYATPAIVDGIFYLRSADQLWAIQM